MSRLDLSYNNIKDSYGEIFGGIISCQAQNRDQAKWKKGLRLINHNAKGGKKDVGGLKELILTHNKFGPNFLRHVLTSIKDDNYIRVIDLRMNQFSNKVLLSTTHYDLIKCL